MQDFACRISKNFRGLLPDPHGRRGDPLLHLLSTAEREAPRLHGTKPSRASSVFTLDRCLYAIVSRLSGLRPVDSSCHITIC
jgi:hypothetical protein